ncbi:MAG: GNAT family N-acetyltransferase [Planctomycetota bacterium]|jgi:predicted N-acetyltransferase YhbS
MRVTARTYDHAADYERVNRFLVRTYGITSGHVNWLQPRWEYMHYHPLIRGVDLGSIGVWEARGDVIGVVHPEHAMGTAYFEIDPEYDALKGEMLRHAEEHLATSRDGVRRLRVFIDDEDDDFQRVAAAMGYRRGNGREPMSHFPIPAPFPAVPRPPGFRLKSLAEDNDLRKVDRVFWRGFGHGDEPPDGRIEDRKFMQSAPNYRKDLNIVVEAPDGHFVSYCGMWYEPVHSMAYVEPVATDPDYRRMGLGRAAVLEGVRRCGELGASVACVGTTLPFYRSLGFQLVYRSSAWHRECA